MTLKALTSMAGGIGPVGDLVKVLAELQGLTFSLVGGQTAGTAHTLAALRQEDTLVAVLNNNAGTITDIKANITIVDCHASGTVTAASAAAADTVTVDGRVYTAIANLAVPANDLQFSVGANDTACAANLAAAINLGERRDPVSSVTAVAVGAVVTITARAEGTGGNAIALATSNNTRLAKSGTTLAGGTATGSFKSSSTTNQVLMLWFNKNA
jgi:hypothetical protein